MIDEAYWAGFGPVLSISDLARIVRKTDVTVWRWLAQKRLPGHNLGRAWIVYREAVRRTIEDDQPYAGLPTELLDNMPDELSIEDLVTLTGKTRPTVYTWLNDGTLPGHRMGRSWLVYKSEFTDMLRSTSNQTST